MEELKLLEKLEKENYKAYIVGGYVRDYLLGIKSNDIDITTDARPLEIKRVFNTDIEDNLGSIIIPNKHFSIQITTFREEFEYTNRHPKIKYVDTLEEDLKRRDFTINTICMDSNRNIIDHLGGKKDLENRLLKVVGDVSIKLTEDPLRILRAVRFAAKYNLKIEKSAFNFIKEHGFLVRELSYDRKRQELDLIFESNPRVGLKLLESLNLLEPLELELNKHYIESNCIGTWAQLNFSASYPFKKSTKKEIDTLKNVINRGTIDEETILYNGLSLSLIGGKILQIHEEDILKMFADMPIKEESKLALNGEEIMRITEKKGRVIKDIKKDLIKNILRGNLPNRGLELEKYLNENWK